jgi:hypothetical protein
MSLNQRHTRISISELVNSYVRFHNKKKEQKQNTPSSFGAEKSGGNAKESISATSEHPKKYKKVEESLDRVVQNIDLTRFRQVRVFSALLPLNM